MSANPIGAHQVGRHMVGCGVIQYAVTPNGRLGVPRDWKINLRISTLARPGSKAGQVQIPGTISTISYYGFGWTCPGSMLITDRLNAEMAVL